MLKELLLFSLYCISASLGETVHCDICTVFSLVFPPFYFPYVALHQYMVIPHLMINSQNFSYLYIHHFFLHIPPISSIYFCLENTIHFIVYFITSLFFSPQFDHINDDEHTDCLVTFLNVSIILIANKIAKVRSSTLPPTKPHFV